MIGRRITGVVSGYDESNREIKDRVVEGEVVALQPYGGTLIVYLVDDDGLFHTVSALAKTTRLLKIKRTKPAPTSLPGSGA